VATPQRLARRIDETEYPVKVETSLSGGGRLLVVLGVDLDKRGLDVEVDHRTGSLGLCGAPPDVLTQLGNGLIEFGSQPRQIQQTAW
jgi:hypothetical protein